MLLTEECVHVQVPSAAAERQKFIAAQEKRWLSLGWDRSRYTNELAQAATRFLSAIAFSDHRDPIDLNLLSDDAGSGADAGSSAGSGASRASRASRGSRTSRGARVTGKRRAEAEPPARKPPKKPKRNGKSTLISSGAKVACLDRSGDADEHQWVLGTVSKYSSDTRKYEVIDDADGEAQIYSVPKRDLRVLPSKPQTFDSKKRVLAVYPQTTVFYPAWLKSRKGRNWVVEFDDEDDNEENKSKEVDCRHIIQE
ncbi:unnamed protein product [Agarophyton chilense]